MLAALDEVERVADRRGWRRWLASMSKTLIVCVDDDDAMLASVCALAAPRAGLEVRTDAQPARGARLDRRRAGRRARLRLRDARDDRRAARGAREADPSRDRAHPADRPALARHRDRRHQPGRDLPVPQQAVRGSSSCARRSPRRCSATRSCSRCRAIASAASVASSCARRSKPSTRASPHVERDGRSSTS